MPTPLERAESAAMQLSPDERAELIDRLAGTLPLELSPEWDAEIARRVAEMDAGGVDGIPAEQVMAQLRAMIEAHAPGRA